MEANKSKDTKPDVAVRHLLCAPTTKKSLMGKQITEKWEGLRVEPLIMFDKKYLSKLTGSICVYVFK